MSVTLATSHLQMRFGCDYSEGPHLSQFLRIFTPLLHMTGMLTCIFGHHNMPLGWHPSRMWHGLLQTLPAHGHSMINDERNIGWVKTRVRATANNTSYPVIAIWCMESFTDLMISSIVARASSSSAVPSEFLLHFSIS